MKQIIQSLLDQDLYKLTMCNMVMKLYPTTKVRYQFINRGEHRFCKGFEKELKNQIKLMENINGLKKDEIDFLTNRCKFLPPTFVDFFSNFKYNSNEIALYVDSNGNLNLSIEGFWYRTIFWEVPIMALISELYFKYYDGDVKFNQRCTDIKTLNKVSKLNNLGVKWADFGTRRRYSLENQINVIKLIMDNQNGGFVGTSNLLMAKMFNIKVLGTMAHEIFMHSGARYGFKMANKMVMEDWVNVYRGDLGTVLVDTYTIDVFLKQFDMMYSKLFDGVRHDSGCPIEFGDKIINHYKKMNIDPLSKIIVFSDGLNVETVEKIHNHFNGKIKYSFGIGTNLMNDCDVKPLNMVIKLTEVSDYNNGLEPTDVIKLSDNNGKHTGNKHMIDLAKQLLKI